VEFLELPVEVRRRWRERGVGVGFIVIGGGVVWEEEMRRDSTCLAFVEREREREREREYYCAHTGVRV
jgi:hypothetical protein